MIEVSPKDTVAIVKLKIQEKSNTPLTTQSVVHESKRLAMHKHVAEYKLKRDSTIRINS